MSPHYGDRTEADADAERPRVRDVIALLEQLPPDAFLALSVRSDLYAFTKHFDTVQESDDGPLLIQLKPIFGLPEAWFDELDRQQP